MKKLLAVLTVVLASGAIVAACTGSSSDNSSSSSSATAAATSMAAATAMPAMHSAAKALPIPLSKLKSLTVAKGSVTAGKVVFDSNCASCHGAGAKNQGGPGPTLAGTGIKPGQVAFMVTNPAAIDPNSGMPKLPLTTKNIADVAAYVASLK